MAVILGVDPGIDGGLAFIDNEAATLKLFVMPTFETNRSKKRRFVDTMGLGLILENNPPLIAYLEEVWSSPQMGEPRAFAFGDSYGCIRGALGSRLIPFVPVLPQLWKGELRLPSEKRVGSSKDKPNARRLAMQLFPHCRNAFSRVKDSDSAEAALIALYGCLQEGLFFEKPLELIDGEA